MHADDVIASLGMQPHPEGGHYVETFRDPEPSGGRAHSTAIYYLLKRGERSHWHRIDAAEVWHHYAGAALEIGIANDAGASTVHILGPDLDAGERPQIVVPKYHWQTAWCLGDWGLVGCTVAPGFDFAGFEMAPKGWTPKGYGTGGVRP